MKTSLVLCVLLTAVALSLPCHSDVLNLGPGLTNLEVVPVGDAGNLPDTRYDPLGFGAVGYRYNIGKYEVTAGQYTEFLNAVAVTDTYGLYNANMWSNTYGCKIQRIGSSGSYTYSVASSWANRPVNYVSYWDACRFANWLQNGQPTGLQTALTTEDGVYTMNGYTGSDGRDIARNAGWKWAVTNEDEWYKAAYYKAGGSNAGYWDYPMRSDLSSTPSNDVLNPDPGNSANFYQDSLTIGYPYFRTNVGEFENSASAYGTFDQGGNVWEWNEALVYQGTGYVCRGLRGWHFWGSSNCTAYLQASFRPAYSTPSYTPSSELSTIGFRVAQAVPEPSSLAVLAAGVGMLLGFRRKASQQ